jgi:transcriptional regulator with GAF, ATPase, and Fis domain
MELHRRLSFEELLADISAIFINLPVEQIDSAIEHIQSRICQTLGFDLSSLWQWVDESGRVMTITHVYSPPGGPVKPEKIDAAEAFPWVYRQVRGGATVVVSAEKVPPEASQDQTSWRSFGIKSSVAIPLSAGSKPLFGILSFDTLHAERCPTQDEVKRLELVAQIFANALVRKAMEETLRKNEERLSLAADFAAAGIWEYDYASKTFWGTPKALEVFGFRPADNVCLARFEKSIHPDDLDLVRQAISSSFEKGEVVDIEYRIFIQPNVRKWISSRGRPQFDIHGKPARLLGLSVDISRQKHLESELKQRLAEVESLKQQLENENSYLREDIRGGGQGFEQVIGDSQSLQSVLMKVRQVAGTGSTVLVQGETGVGKELIAQAIHQLSERRKRLMVTVNCAALPAALIESELFGREKGAYTGALSRQPGRFELANKSTLFLDEIAEMPLETQAKLLRVLQDGRFERLGSSMSISVDVRILAATNRDLSQEVEEGRFRRDLYFRLNVFPINVPPLRDRVEDIPMLVWKFVDEFSQLMGKKISRINSLDMDKLLTYAWPGNVRELRNVVERAMIVSKGNILDLSHLELAPPPALRPRVMSLEDMERQHIQEVIAIANGKIKGKAGAAELLGLNPSTLYSRMRRLGVKCSLTSQRDDISTSKG